MAVWTGSLLAAVRTDLFRPDRPLLTFWKPPSSLQFFTMALMALRNGGARFISRATALCTVFTDCVFRNNSTIRHFFFFVPLGHDFE